MATHNLAPAFPLDFSHDTPAFQSAFASFKENNPHFADREFFDLPLDDRTSILRVAQRRKESAQVEAVIHG